MTNINSLFTIVIRFEKKIYSEKITKGLTPPGAIVVLVISQGYISRILIREDKPLFTRC